MKQVQDLAPTSYHYFISTGYSATEAIKKALTPAGKPFNLPLLKTPVGSKHTIWLLLPSRR